LSFLSLQVLDALLFLCSVLLAWTNLNGSRHLVALEDEAYEGGYVEIFAVLTLQPHILIFFVLFQHCFICRPSVPTDAGIEPRTVATGALAVRRSRPLG
jgi:hypothetical protein